MANGATRLQPLVLNIGQAAGLAAALCLEQGCAPAELPVTALQEALITDPQAPAAPFPLWDTPWHHPHWRERQLACLAEVGVDQIQGYLIGKPMHPDDLAGRAAEIAVRGAGQPVPAG